MNVKSIEGAGVAVVAGAGPAGLTAALELVRRSRMRVIVLEADGQVGGISKTIVYRGNRMDLGGHRFFSKSDWVMRWWQDILPLEANADHAMRISYQGRSRLIFRDPQAPTEVAADSDKVMLVRSRLSRILYRRRFFDYPLRINADSLRNMGAAETVRVAMSYLRAHFFPVSPETSLEDFFINRFGERLYRTFFKSYTEKVWGMPCREISAEWGAQRIKGLSFTKAVGNALRQPFRWIDTAQKGVETSLIERFLYPKLGPGQMWEEVASRVVRGGGVVHLKHRLTGIEHDGRNVIAVRVADEQTGSVRRIECSHLISTLPLCDVIGMLRPDDPDVTHVARHLPYRDFLTVGLLVSRMKPPRGGRTGYSLNGMPPDNWIYIQEPDVQIGRLQIFNNWSPYLIADPQTIWLGLEYFCREGDDVWSMSDDRLLHFAATELEHIGLIDSRDVLDGTIVRVPKAYPAYFGEYQRFNVVRRHLDGYRNLYSVGRNGMHRYNNQDHSMLSAESAVTSILKNGADKAAIWDVNTESDYHEKRSKTVSVDVVRGLA